MDFDLIIIGAGISGLAAARRIHSLAPQLKVEVLEKSRGLGGRMSTRRMEPQESANLPRGLADLGAQFSYHRFEPWSTLLSESASAVADDTNGHARSIHPLGMSRLARAIFPSTLQVRLQTRAKKLELQSTGGIRIDIETTQPQSSLSSSDILSQGPSLRSRAVLLTAPLPQARELLAGSNVLNPSLTPEIPEVEFSSCIALIARLKVPSGLPRPGILENVCPEISGIFDQRCKGLQTEAHVLVIHASPEWSSKNWDQQPELAGRTLWDIAQKHLPTPQQEAELSIHRWKYSRPIRSLPSIASRSSSAAAFYSAPLTGSALPLWISGDAFRMGGVDGAFQSGTLAAEDIIRFFERQKR